MKKVNQTSTISTSVGTHFNAQLFNLASNLKTVSREKNWVVCYDREADSLSLTEKDLPTDISIKYLNNELAVFITPKNDIKGLFIEYVTKNFLSHSEELKDFKKELVEIRRSTDDEVIKLKKSDVFDLLNELQEDLQDLVVGKMSTGLVG